MKSVFESVLDLTSWTNVVNFVKYNLSTKKALI